MIVRYEGGGGAGGGEAAPTPPLLSAIGKVKLSYTFLDENPCAILSSE